MIETSSSEFVDVTQHRQFAAQGDPKVAYSVDTLNHITRNCGEVLGTADIFQYKILISVVGDE